MKNTIVLSALFHVCLLASAVVLYSGDSSYSGKTDKVMFIELAKNEADTGSREEISAKKHRIDNKQTDSRKHQEVYIKKENISAAKDATMEDPVNNIVLLEQEQNLSPSGYKIKGNLEGEVSLAANITISAAIVLSSRGSSGRSEKINKGVLNDEAIEAIRSSIERAKKYPLLARKRGIEGTVHIGFRINRMGEPEDLEIVKGSGSSILDNATIAIVRKAAPFPGGNGSVEIPVVFRLTN